MEIPVGVSNRHVHLNEEDYRILFGARPLEVKKSLRQPGQFASNLVVDIKTDKALIEHVRLVGPLRKYSQVELSRTDAVHLGIDPPIRDSGDLFQAAEVEIIGPEGSIKKECAIIANRHIHMTQEDQLRLRLADQEEVQVQFDGPKGAILDHVKIKVDPSFCLELHLDTDDANAILIKTGDNVQLL